MKKFLSTIATFVLTVLCAISLAACGGGAKDVNAEELLNSIIIPTAGSSVTKDFSVPGKLTRKDAEYNLNWTSDKEYLSVADKLDDKGKYLVSVTRPEAEREEVKLTVSIDKLEGSKEFNFFVVPYDVYEFADTYEFPYDGANLYGEYNLDTELSFKDAKEKCTVAWTTNKTDYITIDNANKKMNVKLSFDKIPATMTATFTYKGQSTTVEYNVNVLQQTIYKPVEELKENTEYVLGLLQVKLDNTYLWMNGKIEDSKRGQTVKDVNAAAKVSVTKLENGNYHLWYKDGDAKKYFTCTGDRILSFTDTATTEWSWDADHNTLLAKGKDDFFLGTYSTFDNISLTTMDHIDENYIAQFYTQADIEAATPTFPDDVMGELELEKFALEPLEAGKHELPTEGKKFSQAKISYAIKGETSAAKLEGNVLTTVGANVDQEFTLTVTVKCGTYEESKDIKVVVLAQLKFAKKLHAGTPYTFQLVQKAKNNTIYYATGKMSPNEKTKFYGELVTDIASANYFFVDEVKGGYNLFVMVDGAKKFVNITSGKHINLKYEDTASSVWVWNEEYNTLTTKATKEGETEKDYYLGTFGNNTTLSASSIDRASTSYVAHFFNVDPLETNVAAGDYKVGLYQNNLGYSIYLNGKMGQHNPTTSGSYYEGLVITVTAVEGGFQLSTKIDGKTKYLNVTSGNFVNLKYEDKATSVYTWNETFKTFTTKASKKGTEDVYYLGTYKNNIDIQPSKLTYLEDDSNANMCVRLFAVMEVNAPILPEIEVGTPNEKLSYTDWGVTSTTEITEPKVKGVITFTFGNDGGQNPPKVAKDEIRFYGSNTLTITSEKTIKQIVIRTKDTKGFDKMTFDSGSFEVVSKDVDWAGEAKSVVIKNLNEGQFKITEIIVVYAE